MTVARGSRVLPNVAIYRCYGKGLRLAFLVVPAFSRPLPHPANLVHPLPDSLLDPPRRRKVVAAPLQILRQALHVGYLPLEIVGVLVPLTVPDLLHERGWRVAQVQRYRFSCRLLNIRLNSGISRVKCI